jgi:5'(3')-deoxyribonucleotidase
MMRIFVDMDDVLVNLSEAWLSFLNKTSNYHREPSDIVDWDMKVAYPDLTSLQVYNPLYQEKMWDNVKPIEDAYYYLKKLIEDGHEVYIATASYPWSFYIKTERCLFKMFDFLSPKNVVCIHDKDLLNGDILFDDYHVNLRYFNGVKVLKNAPYNQNCDEECFHFRVNKWDEFYDIVNEINNTRKLEN